MNKRENEKSKAKFTKAEGKRKEYNVTIARIKKSREKWVVLQVFEQQRVQNSIACKKIAIQKYTKDNNIQYLIARKKVNGGYLLWVDNKQLFSKEEYLTYMKRDKQKQQVLMYVQLIEKELRMTQDFRKWASTNHPGASVELKSVKIAEFTNIKSTSRELLVFHINDILPGKIFIQRSQT